MIEELKTIRHYLEIALECSGAKLKTDCRMELKHAFDALDNRIHTLEQRTAPIESMYVRKKPHERGWKD